MGEDRTALNMNFGDVDDLDDFAPKAPSQTPKVTRKEVDKVSSFPSREASGTGQMNITGNKAILDRFDRMCKADRRARYDMLEILMDAFEGKDHEKG